MVYIAKSKRSETRMPQSTRSGREVLVKVLSELPCLNCRSSNLPVESTNRQQFTQQSVNCLFHALVLVCKNPASEASIRVPPARDDYHWASPIGAGGQLNLADCLGGGLHKRAIRIARRGTQRRQCIFGGRTDGSERARSLLTLITVWRVENL